MAKTLIVASRVKELAQYEGRQLNVASNFSDELTKKVEAMIAESCKRAVLNGRTTVMPKDI
jgi:histone H3/H4